MVDRMDKQANIEGGNIGYDWDNQIEGRNPVLEALRSDRTVEKIIIAKGYSEGRINEIIKKAKQKKVVIQEIDKKSLDRMAKTDSHQGVIAIVTPFRYVDLDDILDLAAQRNELPFVLILDHINDPHNFGAIIRTAEACGVHGIIIPKRRSVGVTPVVAKASAGAVEHMLIARVTNVASTVDDLKKRGLWVAGADVEGVTYNEQDLKGSIALVIGSEGEGISRLVKTKCDFLVEIPMKGKIQSLNASVAASILMYEIVRQRG